MSHLKSLILFLALFLFTINLSGQKVYLWLDAGIKGGYGPNMLINADILNGSNMNPKLNGSYSAGGKIGINFGEYYGITFDGMYSQFKSQFLYKPDASATQQVINDYRWTAVDIFPLFRYNRSINYVELGPKISLVQNVRQANNSSTFTDVSSQFTETNFAAVFGFGWYAAGDDAFTVIVGARMGYQFGDFITPEGYENDQIKLGLVEGGAPTRPGFLQLVVEFNWGLGYYAKTVCGGRARFFRF